MATSNGQFLRIQPLPQSVNIINSAAKHNLREIQAEIGADSRIDPTRTHLNEILDGPNTAADVSALAKKLMLDAGITKLRKNACRGIEVIISLPTSHNCDKPLFFADSLKWANEYFKVPTLSAIVHHDESEPHIHVLLLPLVNGRMVGSEVMGDRKRLQALQTNFYEQVGARYGLTRPKAQPRLSAATRAKAASLILTTLQSNPDLMDGATIEQAMIDTLARHPEAMLKALNLDVPSPIKPKKSFVEIMTKPVKPEKPIGVKRSQKPIGVFPAAEIGNPLCSDRGSAESSSIEAAEGSVPAIDTASNVVPFNDYQRSRDSDQSSQQWDSDRGEFVSKPDPSKPSVRAGAQREVDRMLKRIV
ncbi:MAG: plasmid recombination protein [Rhodocyclaceae bacterium]|nr:plasmid recombination protein [Rhodocyclaceae bacterium]